MARIDYTRLVKPDAPKHVPSRFMLSVLISMGTALIGLVIFAAVFWFLAMWNRYDYYCTNQRNSSYEQSPGCTGWQLVHNMHLDNAWVIFGIGLVALALIVWAILLSEKYYDTLVQGEVIGHTYSTGTIGSFYYLKIRGYNLAGEVVVRRICVQPKTYYNKEVGDYATSASAVPLP